MRNKVILVILQQEGHFYRKKHVHFFGRSCIRCADWTGGLIRETEQRKSPLALLITNDDYATKQAMRPCVLQDRRNSNDSRKSGREEFKFGCLCILT